MATEKNPKPKQPARPGPTKAKTADKSETPKRKTNLVDEIKRRPQVAAGVAVIVAFFLLRGKGKASAAKTSATPVFGASGTSGGGGGTTGGGGYNTDDYVDDGETDLDVPDTTGAVSGGTVAGNGDSYFVPPSISPGLNGKSRPVPVTRGLPVTSYGGSNTQSWLSTGRTLPASDAELVAAGLKPGTKVARGIVEIIAARNPGGVSAAGGLGTAVQRNIDQVQHDLGMPGIYTPAPVANVSMEYQSGQNTTGVRLEKPVALNADGTADSRQFYNADGTYDWTAHNLARAQGLTVD
jgi:hypothetical protein